MTKPGLTLIARNDNIARPAPIDQEKDEDPEDFQEVTIRARPDFVFFSAESESALNNMVRHWMTQFGGNPYVSDISVAASTFSVDGKYRTTVNYLMLEEVMDP